MEAVMEAIKELVARAGNSPVLLGILEDIANVVSKPMEVKA